MCNAISIGIEQEISRKKSWHWHILPKQLHLSGSGCQAYIELVTILWNDPEKPSFMVKKR